MNKRRVLSVIGISLLLVTFCFGCTSGTTGAFLSSDDSSEISGACEIPVSEVTAPLPSAESPGTEPDSEPVTQSEPASEELPPITLGFSGDINFDENWCTMLTLNNCENGIHDCIDDSLMDLTNSFTLFMTNNEFTYSDRGTPMNGKMYTFRARPDRVQLLKEMGTDLVLLANNHIFDYGEDAFYDTLDVLGEAEINHVGAGKNAEEARNILYYDYGDITIAYTAATRAEKNIMTPEASADTPGVFRCYDDTAYLENITLAKSNSDFVVASVHWGTEYSNDATDLQREMAHAMIDAGADAVIGTHPHVLQGMEYYNGKPIYYSLGNYWFNEKTLYSGLAELKIEPQTGELLSTRFYPAIQSSCKTKTATKEEAIEIYDFLENISFDISFDEEGYLSEIQP